MAENDNEEIVMLPLDGSVALPVMQLHPDFGDPEQLLNMRGWLEGACEAKGAKVKGGGMGMGAADIDIELEGFMYNLIIRPILK